MYLLKTKVAFEAAHRLYDVDTYSEECRNNIHGHSYKVTVIIGREQLNSAGMVIDFKLLKKILRGIFDDKYDHSCILKSSDPLCGSITANCDKVIVVEANPTAEWMSHEFFLEIEHALKENDLEIFVHSVEVQETENNQAIYTHRVHP